MLRSHPPHLLHVIGLGADGIAGLSPPVRACLEQAEIIGGSASHLEAVADYPARKLPLGSDIGAWLDRVAELLNTQSVAVLTSGDPLFYGLGRLLTERFDRRCLRFYPQVSSVQLAFSRLGIPWQSATIVSVHGRDPLRLEEALKQGRSPLAVLTDFTHTPGEIARLIRDLRLPVQYQMWVCSHLGGEREQIQSVSVEAAVERTFPSPNVVVLEAEPSEPISPQPLFGIADADFHTFGDRPGLMTKQEVRALSLSQLRLVPGITVWDVGSGTGSMAIEIARLVPDADIYAVEKTEAGSSLIRQNCDRFGCSRVYPVAGVAPEALTSLPDPDRVVLGGGGKDIPAILKTCCQRLRSGGILVAHFATLETCMLAKQQLRELGWTVRLLQVNLARSTTLATTETTRFVPLNPVILLQASRTADLEGERGRGGERERGSKGAGEQGSRGDKEETVPRSSFPVPRSPLPAYGRLWGVGVGPGNGEWLTLKGLKILQTVDVVACPQNRQGEPGMAYNIVRSHLLPEQPLVPLHLPFVRDAVQLQQAWKAAGETLVSHLARGQDVAFITEGDASFYSTFSYVAQAVRELAPGVEITTVPGVCSPLAAAAALEMPLSLAAEKIAVLPALYDVSELKQTLEWAEVVVLMKVASVFAEVWQQLAAAELLEQSSLVEWVGSSQEKIYPNLVSLENYKPPYFSILIVRRRDYCF